MYVHDLYETERVVIDASTIIADLASRIGLQISDKPFYLAVQHALSHSWTRDPFDRLIVAHAALDDAILLSKDRKIRTHYEHAEW